MKDHPEYIGKQMNDCQGYGFMAAKLLGAAGFKVDNYVSVFPGPHGISHDMVLFSHPPEKGYTLTSNDGVFQGSKATEVAKQGFEYAAGKNNVTGKEHFWTGKTMAESQVQMVIKDSELQCCGHSIVFRPPRGSNTGSPGALGYTLMSDNGYYVK